MKSAALAVFDLCLSEKEGRKEEQAGEVVMCDSCNSMMYISLSQ